MKALDAFNNIIRPGDTVGLFDGNRLVDTTAHKVIRISKLELNSIVIGLKNIGQYNAKHFLKL